MARVLAVRARERYTAAADWVVYDDVMPALAELREHGWRHVILSNHVPELPGLVQELGLGRFVDAVISSALTGYEKPHPESFRAALKQAGGPGTAWMIGNNVDADVLGAEAVGLPAILVRGADPRSRRSPRT